MPSRAANVRWRLRSPMQCATSFRCRRAFFP